jgi:type IV pilus assembly protein PilE
MKRSLSKGFTLIELMIVIAIIGILVSVVMPGYRHYVLEAQRNDAQGKLLQMLEIQERFYINNFTYTTDLTALGYIADPHIINYSGSAGFSVSVQTCPTGSPLYPDITSSINDLNRCFRLIATPTGDQVNDGGLVIDTRGRKIHDFASIQPRDWIGNDVPAANCPECSSFPDAE